MNHSNSADHGLSACHGCSALGTSERGVAPPDGMASGMSDGIARRTFLVQSALIAAAAALAACGGGGDATAPSIDISGSNNVLTLASYPTLANVGGIAMVAIGNAPVAIVRTGTSSYVALSRVCPHQGGIVQQSGSGFQCPVHGAQFTSTGTWIGGQHTSNLHAYATSYDAAAGTLTIT